LELAEVVVKQLVVEVAAVNSAIHHLLLFLRGYLLQ
jgi:hypothetical protein